jgi:hypothetical protein
MNLDPELCSTQAALAMHRKLKSLAELGFVRSFKACLASKSAA